MKKLAPVRPVTVLTGSLDLSEEVVKLF